MFDLLTGEVYTSFKVDDGQIYVYDAGASGNGRWIDTPSTWVDGKDYIFLRNQEIDTQHPYSVFDYEYNDIEVTGSLTLVYVSSSAYTYREPDSL